MTLNYSLDYFKELIRTRAFIFGLIIRISSIFVLLGLANLLNDLNDMNEIVYKGLIYIGRGINPYGQWYFLKIFNYGYFEGHNQNNFGYGPFMFILYLPTLLWPAEFATIGTMDFMPAFVLMNNIFDFLTFYHLHKYETFKKISWIYWANPIMVLVGAFSFFNSLFFLMALGFINLENTKLSSFYFALAAISYQYILIFISFIFIYHRNKLKKFIIGLVPAIIVLGIFFVLGPKIFTNDVFLMQFGRQYIPWTSIWAKDVPIAYACSIPALVYNMTGSGLNVPAYQLFCTLNNLTSEPLPLIWLLYPFNFQFDFGIQISTYLTILAIITLCILLLHNFTSNDRDRTFDYMIITYCALIIANQTGLYHYWFILLIPLLFYYKKEDFYKELETH
ncbi:MAG: hypothetical protein HWN67_08745 [Candidatus Helarchaeota archaeon]|nr:hypothetical protein [Candidatus Helarchaeota archaeon]